MHLQPLGQQRPHWPHMTRGDRCRGILGSFPLLTSSTPGVPLMCSCCLFTYRPASHCGLVTLQRQTSNLPLHASSAGSPSSANTLFSSGRPLIHAALAPSPDLALYFWTLLLLIHASLSTSAMTGCQDFHPARSRPFATHAILWLPSVVVPFFFNLPSTSFPCFS